VTAGHAMTQLEETWLPTRQTLLSRLKNWDDQKSWREFFNLYWRLIYGVARQAGLSDAESQDVVQETILTVAKQMPEFRYDKAKGSFKSWLRKTARWRIQDQFRRRQRDQRLTAASSDGDTAAAQPEATSDHDPFEAIWEEEWRQNLLEVAIDRVKKQVEPREFQVFDLCTNKQWSPARVARALHLFRPQVYYFNKKITRLIEREASRLNNEI
jgi:RNA polymerase sigma factor (sigma-70 family)